MINRASNLYHILRSARNRIVIRAKRLPAVDKSTSIHPTAIVSNDLVAEEYAFVGRGCEIGPMTFLGRYTMLASGVSIIGGDHISTHVGVPIQFTGRPIQQATKIERDVWIGRNSIILRGVTIGEGAIIAAGAVVTRDVEPYTVMAGTPARSIKTRFSDSNENAKHSKIINGPIIAPRFASPLIKHAIS